VPAPRPVGYCARLIARKPYLQLQIRVVAASELIGDQQWQGSLAHTRPTHHCGHWRVVVSAAEPPAQLSDFSVPPDKPADGLKLTGGIW
jgi:hypothetical protein